MVAVGVSSSNIEIRVLQPYLFAHFLRIFFVSKTTLKTVSINT